MFNRINDFHKNFFLRDASNGLTTESRKLSEANGASLGRVELKPQSNISEEPLKRNMRATPFFRQSNQEEIDKDHGPSLFRELSSDNRGGIYIFRYFEFRTDFENHKKFMAITIDAFKCLDGFIEQGSYQRSTPEENLMSFITHQDNTPSFQSSKEMELSKKIDILGRYVCDIRLISKIPE